MNQLIQDLKTARAIIEDPRHWTRGRLTDGMGAYCLLGAIEIAVNGVVTTPARPPDNIGRIDACKSALGHVIGSDAIDGIAHYNDKHTHEEILGILDQAIKNAV
jgi:hypothetical protein